MKRLLLPIGLVILAVGVFAVFLFTKSDNSANGQVKTAHFQDSTPLHNEVYAAQPINVTINFNFDLAAGSKISVTDKGGREWAEGESLIEDADTALKRKLKPGLPDGSYVVKYSACWPDKSCHDGRFVFMIDSSMKSSYKDFRGKPEVTMDMKNIRFAEEKILISPGTKVTWVNQDEASHYVNTETHPEHTYFPEQNSRELTKGLQFSQTFQIPGQYNYHCSAHADVMTASLIVSS